jgi:hypothetical protein
MWSITPFPLKSSNENTQTQNIMRAISGKNSPTTSVNNLWRPPPRFIITPAQINWAAPCKQLKKTIVKAAAVCPALGTHAAVSLSLLTA